MIPFPTLAQGALEGISEIAVQTGERFGFNFNLFISQVISFAVVALLLHRFAYKPILTVLEERRVRIEEGLANADKIKQQLADAELKYQEVLSKANADGQKLIEEARESSAKISEKRQAEAIAQAEQIITKANQAAKLEYEQLMGELKKEIGRLVIDTTSKVSGKVLTPEDQKRLKDETARQIAA